MTTYKFNISKKSQAIALDPTSRMSDDATAGTDDIDVTVYLDDVSKHTATVTDSGATLQFTADLSQGDHTIRIKPDATGTTTICVDEIIIDDKKVVATKWDYNNQILGTTSTARQTLARPHAEYDSTYVWFGNINNTDNSLDLAGPFYRPSVSPLLGGEWAWTFTRTSAGKLHMAYTGDVDHPLWDSTENHEYLFVNEMVSTFGRESLAEWPYVIESPLDSSTIEYRGPGTYNADLAWVSDNVSTQHENANALVIFNQGEWAEYNWNKHWYMSNSLTPVTTS